VITAGQLERAEGIALLCDPDGGSVFVVTLPERGLEGAWPRS
jgi:hypothetical protein